jgi:hypothetical protein
MSFLLLRQYRAKISLNFKVAFSCAITMATYHGILSLLYILRLFWCPVDKNPTGQQKSAAEARRRQKPTSGSFLVDSGLLCNQLWWFTHLRVLINDLANQERMTMPRFQWILAKRWITFITKVCSLQTRNSWTRSNQSTSLFFPVIEISISSENCYFTSRTLLSLAVKSQ